MEIVINISKRTYDYILKKHNIVNGDRREVTDAICDGTPLPKGHGKLIDVNKLKTHYVGTEQGTDLEVYLETTVVYAQTIIEADKESED